MQVVERHDTVGGNVVVSDGQHQLRHNAATSTGERGDNNSIDAIGDGVSREHEHRPVAPVRDGGKPDLTP
jgi:hypothetical protein